jgi:hypothetical protein
MTDTKAPGIELVIRVTPEGQINVTGPLHNKSLCYGLLECARDIVKDHTDKMTRSTIVPARVADPMLIRQRPNGASGG